MPSNSVLCNLSSISCQIVSLNLSGASAQRLKALGIFEGQTVSVQKRGNPLILKAAGGRVAIAKEIASQIVVQAVGG